MIAQIVLYSISMNGGYCVIVWCEYRALQTIRFTKGAMRESTRKVHGEVHNALLTPAICPLCSSIIPSSFFVMAAFFRVDLGISSASSPF
ncbi:hypothetical protein AAVH_16943 [Aphelenchoides avenae]|nr:hypothetical protein AAVH_16943 [Aphelenchus avenae]